jgi:hypothetical protein
LACGCQKANAPKTLISEVITTKDKEIEVVQRFSDGSENKVVIKRRNIGVQRKI